MGWYKKTVKERLSKLASKMEAKQNAIKQLENGVPPAQVVQEFMGNMMRVDPSFPASQLLVLRNNGPALKEYLNTVDLGPETPTPQVPQIPQVPAQAPIDPTQPPTNIPPEAGGVLEEPKEEVTQDEIETPLTDSDRPIDDFGTPILTDISDQLESDPDPNEKIKVDPTIRGSYEVPSRHIPRFRKRLAKINRQLAQLHHPALTVDIEGEPYEKPVMWRGKGDAVGKEVMEQFFRVKINGTLPAPAEIINISIREPEFHKRGPLKGQPKMEADGVTQKTRYIEKQSRGIKFITKVNFHALDEEEQNRYLADPKTGPNLKAHIEESRKNRKVPHFNTFDGLERDFDVDGRFHYSDSRECVACTDRRKRNSAYIAVICDPSLMTTRLTTIDDDSAPGGKREIPMQIFPEELLKKADPNDPNAQKAREGLTQVQIGGSCANQVAGVSIISDIHDWVKGLTKNEKDKTHSERTKKHKPGTPKGLPSEHLFATAVNMMRDPKNQQHPALIARRLAVKTNYYVNKLKREEAKTKGKDIEPRQYNNYYDNLLRQADSMAPRIDDFDRDLGKKIRSWWSAKFGGMGLDLADNNKISVSIWKNVPVRNNPGQKNIRDIAEMVSKYIEAHNTQLPPLPPPPPEPKPEPVANPPRPRPFDPMRFRDTQPGERLPAEQPEVAEIEAIEPVAAPGPESPVPTNLVDIEDVQQNGKFVSKLKYRSAYQWNNAQGRGTKHTFVDNRGRQYISWDSYDPRNTFEQGQEYYIQGTKGPYSGRGDRGSTKIYNLKKWEPEGVAPAPTPASEEQATILGDPVEPKHKIDLPSWYPKHDLGVWIEDKIKYKIGKDGQPFPITRAIKTFLDRMADISEKWKQPEYRKSEEFILNRIAIKEQYGGEEGLIAKLKEIYERDRPKI